ncbi:RNA-directed DNA polymerase, eukaryota, reverse transcriptase zinc-binding domain protein [Tanacetum coccineum]
MEGLHIALRDAMAANMFHGVMIGSSDFRLFHLFYADDVIIVSNWDQVDMDNIIRVFHVFYMASSLKININKSSLYGVGVSSDEVVRMAGSSGCMAGSLPLTYLGLPIGFNMNRVARSLGIYYMSIFKAPETVIKELERLRASFFWSANEDKKKLAWVKWSNVLASFNKGGLGVGSLKSFNVFLLYKWRWQMLNNLNTLWVKVIKSIHGVEASMDVNGCQSNGLWSRIVGSINQLHSSGVVPLCSIRYKVGNGSLIRFWLDTWVGDLPLRDCFNRLDHLENFKDCMVTQGNDSYSWSLSLDGNYSVSNLRHHIDDYMFPSISPSSRWCKMIPRKLQMYGGLLEYGVTRRSRYYLLMATRIPGLFSGTRPRSLRIVPTRSDNEDANEHIEKVLEIVDLFHIPNITQDQVMLEVFSMSLTVAASRWLRNKPAGSIKTWETLKENFLRKYCPPARTAKKIEEINNFQQDHDETLYQA